MKRLFSGALALTVSGLVACTTAQGTDALKVLSQLLGGQPDRAQMRDPSVREALQYEFERCLNGKPATADVQAECIEIAYATVKEDMNLEERPGEGGRIIIERVDDDVQGEPGADSEE